MAVQVFCPAAAAMGEVLAMGDQPLVKVAGEQWDAVGAWVMPEEVAGHADLVATAGAEHVLIEPGPVLDRINAGGLQTGEGGPAPRPLLRSYKRTNRERVLSTCSGGALLV